MGNAKSTSCEKRKLPDLSDQNHLAQKSIYQVDGKTFVVEPVFKPDAMETVGTILVNLMRTDASQG